MIIGCPTEIKTQEHRVGLVPSSVKELVAHGHTVLVQSGAGEGINFSDEIYKEHNYLIKSIYYYLLMANKPVSPTQPPL